MLLTSPDLLWFLMIQLREISLQRSPLFYIGSHHFETNAQRSGRAGPLSTTPFCPIWIWREAWSAAGSVLLCLVACVKMPSCSAPGCTNRTDEDSEKRLSLHNFSFKNKRLAKKLARPASSDARFMPKKLENVYVCNEHSTEDCYEVGWRYEIFGAKTRKRRLIKQDGHHRKFFVCSDARNLFESLPRSKMQIRQTF